MAGDYGRLYLDQTSIFGSSMRFMCSPMGTERRGVRTLAFKWWYLWVAKLWIPFVWLWEERKPTLFLLTGPALVLELVQYCHIRGFNLVMALN